MPLKEPSKRIPQAELFKKARPVVAGAANGVFTLSVAASSHFLGPRR